MGTKDIKQKKKKIEAPQKKSTMDVLKQVAMDLEKKKKEEEIVQPPPVPVTAEVKVEPQKTTVLQRVTNPKSWTDFALTVGISTIAISIITVGTGALIEWFRTRSAKQWTK